MEPGGVRPIARRCMCAGSRMANRPSIRSVVTKSALCANCAGNFPIVVLCLRPSAAARSPPDAVNRHIKRLGERAGFAFPVQCSHALRHGCGYALANIGP